jgi:hypothetical protein
MVIANPIYDVVFKRMMENDKVAKFFIGTLLEQTVETDNKNNEIEAWRTIDAMTGGLLKKVMEQSKAIKEKDELISELLKKLEGK